MKCQFCGKDLKENAKFCDGCGAQQEEVQVNKMNNVYREPQKIIKDYL